MDGASLLIVIAVTWWLTARHYKKKFGIKTVYIVEQPEQQKEEKEVSLAQQAYRSRKARGKVEIRDE